MGVLNNPKDNVENVHYTTYKKAVFKHILLLLRV